MNRFLTILLLLFGLIIGPWLNAQTTISGDGTHTFSTPGDETIIIPDGCTADIQYEIWGGGGAGGYINDGNASTPLRAAAGGGGGGYSTGTLIAQGAGTYTITVGAGGVLTNMTTTRQSGTSSSAFGVTSAGGQGAGGGATAGNGGGGDIPGGAGGTRAGANSSGGGGGGGSGPLPGPGGDGVGGTGGAGGTTNGGDGGNDQMDGADGTSPGGGGGGKGSGGAGLGGLKSGNGADGQVILIVTNYACNTNCYPETTAEADNQPGVPNTNPASCDISAGDPTEVIEVPTFDCAVATAITFETPILPSNPSVLYHYWGNCSPLSPAMPVGISPRSNGYIQQMFCETDAFGLPAFSGGLSGDNGIIDFLPQRTEDVGCNGFAEIGTCDCGGNGGANAPEKEAELIQIDFWMAVPEIQSQVGFRFSTNNREDASSFFVGADLNDMCEVAFFTDGQNHDDLVDQLTGTFNIDNQLPGTCGLLWMRVRLYINDIADQFEVNPQINAGNGWVDIDQLLIEPATSADDNTVPTVATTTVTGYLIDGEFVYDDGGTWDPYGCNPVVTTTDPGVCNLFPLPVEFLSFNAALNDKHIALKWQTASEENNEGFEIQKSSNGRDWEILDWVKGNGTTSEINTYDYLDKTPFTGDNYYRLKQVDSDGQFEFSDIAIVRYKVSGIVVEVSPNPSPGDVNVTVLNPQKEKMSIDLYDSAGLLIWQSGTLANLDTWRKQFTLPQKELYFISVQVGKELFTKKIIIIDSF